MSWARVLSTSAATAAVAGCVVLAVGMSRADTPVSSPAPTAAGTHAPIPATKAFGGQASSESAPGSSAGSSTARPALASAPAPSSRPVSPSRSALPSATQAVALPGITTGSSTVPRTVQRPAARPVGHPAPVPRVVTAKAKPKAKGSALPLHYGTGSATKVITVTAHSTRSTTATVQQWSTMAGGGWKRVGSPITAHIGSDGMSTHASESRSATPMGSFTLTQAFGRDSNPGTALPYLHTTPSDYWISDEGPKYNTHQRCSSCGYNDGVNERLYYVTPEYDYAAVIDYNTRNAPGGVRAGRGSAFFLHVTDGSATAGCVAIPKSRLVPLLRWLTPGAHPRILIGTA